MNSYFLPLLSLVICLPLLTGLVLTLLQTSAESTLRRLATGSGILWLVGCLALSGTWISGGRIPLEVHVGDLVHYEDYHFSLRFLFDGISATFLLITALLGNLIMKYCHYYLHREKGYARFFITIFFFLGAMSFVSCAGTLDVLFIGWEVLGIASFLLIAFYRNRLSPLRNALKAFTIYHLCDLGILLGVWLLHQILPNSYSFLELSYLTPIEISALSPKLIYVFSAVILLGASGKSAQFPFSFWLPRAMEGPTPSSAIFYGALSVHAGVLLLLRTAPLWQSLPETKGLVGGLGLLTALLCTLIGRAQPNIKAQIGYASITQIGLMLVELSLGWNHWVLFHFVTNALLRSYQLLVSPSVVAQLLRIQSASLEGIKVSDWSLERKWIPRGLQTRFYAFAFNEGYFESLGRFLFWKPISRLGDGALRIDSKGLRWLGALSVFGLLGYLVAVPDFESNAVALFCVVGIGITSLLALKERFSIFACWNAIGISQLFGCALVGVTGEFAIFSTGMQLTGIVPSWIAGALALRALRSESGIDLRWHYGRVSKHPLATLILFLACLGVSGFPITPAILGIDLMFHQLAGKPWWLVAGLAAMYFVNGIAAMRLFARVCLGPEESPYLLQQIKQAEARPQVERPGNVLSIS